MPGWGARFFAHRAIIASRGPANESPPGAWPILGRKRLLEVGTVTPLVISESPGVVACAECPGYNSASASTLGTWRSPVAHCNGVAGVAGSNPAVPTLADRLVGLVVAGPGPAHFPQLEVLMRLLPVFGGLILLAACGPGERAPRSEASQAGGPTVDTTAMT